MKRNVNKNQQVLEEVTQSPSADNYQSKKKHKTNLKQPILKRLWHRLAFVKYIALILITPPILNYASLKRESDALHPQGEQVAVGWGQKMFISCMGEGIPTVILDAPTGFSSDVWIQAQRQISEHTKVCIYDRSGIGFSDFPFVDVTVETEPSNTRRYAAQPGTVKQMVDDLHYLITKAKPLPRPFIMVGSEISSLTARYYAHLYEKEVVGIVLVDPLVENMFTASKGTWSDYWYSHLLPSIQSLHLSSSLGLSRLALLVGWLSPPLSEDHVAPEVILRQKYLLCNPSHMSAVFNEHLYMNASFLQMSDLLQSKPFPASVSVDIISSQNYDKYPENLNEVWKKSQQYLIEELHPKSTHKVVESSGNSLYGNPLPIVEKISKLIRHFKVKEKVTLSSVD